MLDINAPPVKLKATMGVDSVHILIAMNKFDLSRFCIDKGYRYKTKQGGRYQRKWFIFLQDGEPVTATYNFRSRTIKFEIGNLLNYSINRLRHQFIQQLFLYFLDRESSIKRLDIAVDINMKRDDLIVKNSSKITSTQRVKSSTYNNANGHVFIAYDKSSQLEIFSTDLTRLELRLNSQLASWKVGDFLSNKKSFEKLIKKIDSYFKHKVEINSNDGLTLYSLSIDIHSVISNFVAFVHGDSYKYNDYFRVKQAVQSRNRFYEWMKLNNLTTLLINHFVKGRRAEVCKELELNSRTFKKAVDFYKSITNIKV